MNIPKNIVEAAQWILENCIIIDTETTGLGENDTVIEIAALNATTEEVMVNTLTKPHGLPNPQAMAINKINELELFEAGVSFTSVYHGLLEAEYEQGLHLTSFNRVFDERLCRQTGIKYSTLYGRPWGKVDDIDCIMELANRAFHEHLEWDAQQSKFKRLSLAKCLEIAGIEFDGEPHRALTDAKATLELVKFIANGGQ